MKHMRATPSRLYILTLILIGTLIMCTYMIPADIEVNTYAIEKVPGIIEVNTYPVYREFSITSSDDLQQACSCAQISGTFTITNQGSTAALFNIQSDTPVVFSETSFSLNAQESRLISYSTKSSCEDKTSTLTFTIANNLGVTKTLTKRVIFEQCQNIELRIEILNKSFLPCMSATAKIYVKNIATFPEEYDISSSYKGATITPAKLILKPNETGISSATITPQCGIYGEVRVPITVHALHNDLNAKQTITAQFLQSGFDYTVRIDSTPLTHQTDTYNRVVCNRLTYHEIPITITNTGVVDNNYTIRIKDLPNYITFQKSDRIITVPRGASKTVTLIADTSNYYYQRKTQEFTITIIPAIGDLDKTQKVKVTRQLCFDHAMDIIAPKDNSQKNPIVVCQDEVYVGEVVLKNMGSFNERFTIDTITAPKGTLITRKEVTVKPAVDEYLNIFVNGGQEQSLQNITLRATLPIGFSVQDSLWIQTYPKSYCYNATIPAVHEKVNYDKKVIIIPFTYNGIRNETFDVTYKGSKIAAINLTELQLSPGQHAQIPVQIESNNLAEGTYTGTLTLTGAASQESYPTTITITLKDKTAFRKAVEYFLFGSFCRQFSVTEIIIILLIIAAIIYVAIRGPHYPYKFWNRVKYKLPVLAVLIAVFILGVLLVVATQGLPKSSAQAYNLTRNYSTLEFEMLQDRTFTLDTGAYFTDPDNNTLTYTVEEMTHIKTQISGSKITFYPDLGWSGIAKTRIIANDNRGGITKSPTVTLNVIAKPKLSATAWYTLYCWYTNLAYFAIILALVFLFVVIKQKKRVRKK